MSQNIPCFDDIQYFINDFNTWISGADNADVTLHDNYVMPSYRKFAKSELYRPGVTWLSTTNYLKDDIISYQNNIYVALSNSTNILPTNTIYWKKIEAGGVKEGVGISAFCSFLSNDKTLLTSKNIQSFAYTGIQTFEITLPNGFSSSLYSIGFSYESFNIADIERYKQYVLTGRQVRNDGQVLEIQINPNLLHNVRVDICFFNV